MRSDSVLNLYNLLKGSGITIWIDGGWCIDALLGRQTRSHSDLDIAVHRNDSRKVRQLLESDGFKEEKRPDSSEWMYVLKHDNGMQVDVHAFHYDDAGNNVYGIEYPYGSLTGIGIINGQEVNCIAPEWMYRFKTAYEPKEKDIQDIQALSGKFEYELPERYHSDDKITAKLNAIYGSDSSELDPILAKPQAKPWLNNNPW